jgi:coenzyme F420-0:L-glutamate ligase / coenzyme F420-1:gamma-L-glutamate ligase
MTGPITGAPHLHATSVRWPEVKVGDDLAELVLARTSLRDGDVLAVTSKVVSKSEGRGLTADRADVIAKEAVRQVARRGSLVIAETRHGLVLAAAGVDASNAEVGTVLALPLDPDGTARQLRVDLLERSGRNVAVVITDTAGRPWREGQTDIAIGCAGIPPVVSLAGTVDSAGQELSVTAPAIADEIAATGDLVKGKVSGCPLAVLHGLGHLVLPPGRHGPGASAIVRPAVEDLFALGARDAAVAAVMRDDPAALTRFPALTAEDADPFARLPQADGVQVSVHARTSAGDTRRAWSIGVSVAPDAPREIWVAAGRVVERVHTLAAAHGLVEGTPPSIDAGPTDAWTVVDRSDWVTS